MKKDTDTFVKEAGDKFIEELLEPCGDILPFAAHYISVPETDEHEELTWLSLNDYVIELVKKAFETGFRNGIQTRK